MRKKTEPSLTPPTVTHAQGLKLVDTLIEKGRALLAKSGLVTEEDMNAWEALLEDYLVKTFGSNSPNVNRAIDAGRISSYPMSAGDEWWNRRYRQAIEGRIAVLQSLVEILQTENQLSGGKAPQPSHNMGSNVFIVHGHNDEIPQALARYCEKLNLEAIILHERANKGRTIIEKFEEECKEAGFALIVMTGDDRGGLANESYDQQRPRARQNVILELGFFLGRLSRSRVVVIYEENVEVPSDYNGVLFIKWDSAGAWRLHTAREMKSAGLDIDLNLAL